MQFVPLYKEKCYRILMMLKLSWIHSLLEVRIPSQGQFVFNGIPDYCIAKISGKLVSIYKLPFS